MTINLYAAEAAAQKDPTKYQWYQLAKGKAKFDSAHKTFDLEIRKGEKFGLKFYRGSYFLVDADDLSIQFKLSADEGKKLISASKPFSGKVAGKKVEGGEPSTSVKGAKKQVHPKASQLAKSLKDSGYTVKVSKGNLKVGSNVESRVTAIEPLLEQLVRDLDLSSRYDNQTGNILVYSGPEVICYVETQKPKSTAQKLRNSAKARSAIVKVAIAERKNGAENVPDSVIQDLGAALYIGAKDTPAMYGYSDMDSFLKESESSLTEQASVTVNSLPTEDKQSYMRLIAAKAQKIENAAAKAAGIRPRKMTKKRVEKIIKYISAPFVPSA